MINKVTIPNDADIIIVSMGDDNDEIQFASDLKSSLMDFKLSSIDSSNKTISFDAKCIDFSSSRISDYKSVRYNIQFGCKVLIRNKMIVETNCTPLINHKLLILK